MSRTWFDVVTPMTTLQQACMQTSSQSNQELNVQQSAQTWSYVHRTLSIRSAATFLVSLAMYSKDNDSNASPARIAMSSP